MYQILGVGKITIQAYLPPDGFEAIPNYRGTGRTLLRWRWTNGTIPADNNHRNGDISFEVTISQGVTQGTLTNDSYLTSNAGDIKCENNNQNFGKIVKLWILMVTVIQGHQKISMVTSTIFSAKIAKISPSPPLPVLEAKKQVKGQLNNNFSGIGQTVPGGQGDYRLTVTNIGTVPTTEI